MTDQQARQVRRSPRTFPTGTLLWSVFVERRRETLLDHLQSGIGDDSLIRD